MHFNELVTKDESVAQSVIGSSKCNHISYPSFTGILIPHISHITHYSLHLTLYISLLTPSYSDHLEPQGIVITDFDTRYTNRNYESEQDLPTQVLVGVGVGVGVEQPCGLSGAYGFYNYGRSSV